ncbi:MAG TPA: hypothetical protein VNS58_25705 [Puia sp.]|nr:hypothetical protein [Puia sp.]
MKTSVSEMKKPVSDASTSLIISKQQKQALSKEQQTFNRLIKKIEKLQAELEKSAHTLQQKLDFYGKHIYPLEQRELVLLKELTRCLYQFFRESHLFSRNDKAILGEIISMQLHNILHLEQTEPDDEFKEIFRAVEKRDYDEAAEEELDLMKEEMASMFEGMGVDLNIDDMDRKMTEEEIFQKITELKEQFRKNAERNDAPPRRKTKKQLEKEANEKKLEEARAKSINSIYKQLVKIFHPDLEQDPDIRLEKEELMKKLTTSYKSGDLHTLLKLELQWIQQEGINVDKLTDDKLALYNESLKQQANDLEGEINQLLHHPRYQPLYQFAASPNQLLYISVNDIKRQKKSLLGSLSQSLQALQGNANRALAEIREVIYTFKNRG